MAADASTANARDFQLVAQNQGWVLTDTSLVWAVDPATVRDITPTGQAASDIRGVFFLDALNGWAAALVSDSETSSQWNLWHTVNGGVTWTSSTLTASPGAAGNASLSFTDALHGWLLIQMVTSSNFSVGDLYRTEDGGATWNQLTAPSAGSLHFVTSSLGFLAGGPLNDHLYVTRDGGGSWQEVFPEPLPYSVSPGFDTPTFSDSATGVLPVTLGDPTTTVRFYKTTDAGQSWTLKGTAQVSSDYVEPGVVVPTAVLSTLNWIVISTDDSTVLTTQNEGKDWASQVPQGLPSGVAKVQFSSGSHGWSLIQSGSCAPDKTTCSDQREVRWTNDGGQTWAVVGG